MNIVVLLSAGRHPQSDAARPVPVELQGVAIALAIPGATITGLHAGTPNAAVADALGHGLGSIIILRIDPESDPLPALAAELATLSPDLVLAGRRGSGGTDSGLLPYRLAHQQAWPIVPDAVAISRNGENLAVIQALPRGARRRVVLPLPAVVTISDASLPARPFIQRARRSGITIEKPGVTGPGFQSLIIEHPYRPRPRLIGPAATPAGGQLMIGPDPEVAARAIGGYLARLRLGGREEEKR